MNTIVITWKPDPEIDKCAGCGRALARGETVYDVIDCMGPLACCDKCVETILDLKGQNSSD